MRYSYYWIPKNDTELGRYGTDWFLRNNRFNQIIQKKFPEYKYSDFLSALQIPAHYGFHAEIIAPFELGQGRTEADAFTLLKKLVRLFSQFDLTMRLSSEGNRVYLDSSHDISAFRDIKKEFCAKINTIICDPMDMQSCLSPLEINLAQTDDTALLDQIYNVATLYWKDVLKKNVTFDAISLCYQRNYKSPFKELTRLPLKMVY